MAFTGWRKKRNPQDPDKLLSEMSSVLWETHENPPEGPNAFSEPGRTVAQIEAMDRTAEALEVLKSPAGTIRMPSDPLSLQSAAKLQEQMISAKEAILRSLQTEADTVAGRVRASRSESEALIAKAEELQQKLQSDMEKSQGYIQEASRQALGSVMEELQGRISKELEGGSSSLVERARRQMREEMTAAVEVLSGEACRIVAEKIAPSVEAELEKSLRRSAGELFTTLAQTAREEAESSCRSAVATAVESIHNAAAEAGARLERLQVGANAGGASAEPMQGDTSSSDAALEELRRKSQAVLGEVQTQLQDTGKQLRSQTENSLQKLTTSLKEQTLRSLQTEADTVAGRLRASRSESEALIAKAEELQQKLQSDMEKSQGYIQEASRQALGSVMEELQGRISKELEGSSSSLVERARRQMREEMTAAVEVLSGEACRIVVEKIAPSVEAELENSLRRSAGELFTTLAQTAREEAESSCRSAVATAVESIHNAAAEAGARLERLQVGASAGGASAEPVQGDTSSSDAALEELRRKSEAVLGEVQTQLQDTLTRLREKDLQQALDHIHKAAEDLLHRSGKELQKLATDTLWSTTDKLNDFASRLIEQTVDRHSEKELPKAANDATWAAPGKYNGLGTRVVDQSVDYRFAKKVPRAISEPGPVPTDKGSHLVSTLPERTKQERIASSAVPLSAVQPRSAAAIERSEVPPPRPFAGLMQDSQPGWRRHLAGLGLMWWCQTCLWAVVVAVPLFLFIRFSLRPVMRLSTEPPAGFFVASPDWDARERAQEESLSRAYWDRAVRHVQWRYAFGTALPEQPTPEFNVLGNDPSPKASDSRLRYWQALRSVWLMPQVWQKSYEWNTEWAWHHLVNVFDQKMTNN